MYAFSERPWVKEIHYPECVAVYHLGPHDLIWYN